MPRFRQIAHGVVDARQITDKTQEIQAYNAETDKMETIVGEKGDWVVTQGTQVQIVKDEEFRALYHPVDKVIPPIPPTNLDDGEDDPEPWKTWNEEK